MPGIKEILKKFKKTSTRFLNENKNRLFGISVASIVFFLIINIIYSQNVSEIFFGLTNNNRHSTIEFLKRIRQTSGFEKQLDYFVNIYGPVLKNQVFSEEIKREVEINKFEQLLEKNYYSRDILYRLYQLYLEK